MHDYLAMLSEPTTISKWELRVYAGSASFALYLLKLGFDRFLHKWDAYQKVRRDDHIRLWQHDDEIVEGLRQGTPFPNLTKDE